MKTNFSNKLRLFVGETLRALQVDHQLKEGWLRIVSAAGEPDSRLDYSSPSPSFFFWSKSGLSIETG